MSPPPWHSDHRSPKRQRFPPLPSPPPTPVSEEEEDDNSDESVHGDDEEDYSDESADDDDEGGDEEEEEDDVELAMATVGGNDTVTEEARRSVSISSPSSSSSSSHLSVKLTSPEVLDCPTCLDPLRGPIYQCRNGHITCSVCLPKVHRQCPTCRIPIGNIRCRAMERLIESSFVPCCNAVYGCKETVSYGNESEHENVCVHVRCTCPLPDCDYTGGYKDLQTHARDQHSWDVENLTPFEFDCPQMFTINLAKKRTAVFQEDVEGDLIVVQAFRGKRGGVCVTVSCIAPSSLGVSNLSCSLAKLNAHATLKIGMRVKKIQKVREQEEPKEDFLFIPDYMLTGDYCNMQICVGNEFMYVHI